MITREVMATVMITTPTPDRTVSSLVSRHKLRTFHPNILIVEYYLPSIGNYRIYKIIYLNLF